MLNGFWAFIAACCYHNSSKSSLSTPSYCTTYYLELWPLSLSLSYSTYGTDTNSKILVLCLTLLCFMMFWITHFPIIRTINTWRARSPMVMMLKAMIYNQRIQIESVDYISDLFSSIQERSGCWGQNCLTAFKLWSWRQIAWLELITCSKYIEEWELVALFKLIHYI